VSPYAYLCDKCGHLVSRHGLVRGAESVQGPYRCRDCECEMSQTDPVTGLGYADYHRWAERNKRFTWDERLQRKVARR
jgi:hypothetical protein